MPGNGRRWWRSAARRANERQETTRARPLVGILGYTYASSALQLSFELIELLYRCRLGLMCRSNALFRLRWVERSLRIRARLFLPLRDTVIPTHQRSHHRHRFPATAMSLTHRPPDTD